MSDVLVKPAFQSALPDNGSPTQLGPTAWNASRLFTGGSVGDLTVRDTNSATGAAWASISTLLATYPVSALTLQAAVDGVATLGSELLDGTGWTSAGWTGAFNAFTHTPGNTSALSRAIAGIAAGQFYQVVITITGSTAGSLTFSIGGQTVTSTDGTSITGNASFRAAPQTLTSGGLIITPTTNFDGAVSLSVTRVTAAAASAYVLKDSSGTVSALISNILSSRNNLAISGPSGLAGYLGGGSLSYATTGTYNTAFGPNAPLASNTTGTYNTAIGGGALRLNTTGWYNTAIGDDALAFNTTGFNNTAVGVDALYTNTSGQSNTAVGFLALMFQTTGGANTGVGTGALQANVTSSNNTAVGSGAASKTTAGNNTAIGVNALQNNVSGVDLVAVGYQALVNSTAAAGMNVGIGSSALFSNTSGNANTAIGHMAGYTETPANANVTGSGNTYLGIYAGPANNTVQNFAIAIGYQAHPSASGHAVIGSTQVTDVYLGSESPVATCHALNYGATGYYEGTEMTAPGAGAVNTGRLYFDDNGSGKTRLMVQFNTGVAIQVAIQV